MTVIKFYSNYYYTKTITVLKRNLKLSLHVFLHLALQLVITHEIIHDQLVQAKTKTMNKD